MKNKTQILILSLISIIKNSKINIEIKNLALAKCEKFVVIYTLHFIHETVSRKIYKSIRTIA